MPEEEEFELIPMSPMRRLERRLDRIESTKGIDVKSFFSQLVEIVKMNQQLVDELAKSSDALRIEIARLPAKLDELIGNMNELVSFIKASAGGEAAEAAMATDLQPLLGKMDSLIELNKKIVESNETMMATMDKLTKVSKRVMGPPMVRRPTMRPMRPMKRPNE
jgi:uncharacterized coiled-coil protein SlyX